MSSPRSISASTAVVVAIAVVTLFAGIAVVSGADVLRFIPIVSMLLAGLVALSYVTRYRASETPPQAPVQHTVDTGIQR
jgi:hypothetical protein